MDKVSYVNVTTVSASNDDTSRTTSTTNCENDEDELTYDYPIVALELKDETNQLRKRNEALQQRCNILENLVSALQVKNKSLLLQLEELEQKYQGGQNIQKDTVRKFSAIDVQTMLDRMEMPQYITVFAKENITGALLLELDEDILQYELGIKATIHRKRLMRIINGQEDIDKLMETKLRTLV